MTSETYICITVHGAASDTLTVERLLRHEDGSQSFDINFGSPMRFVRMNLNREQIADLARGVQSILDNWDTAKTAKSDAL